MDVVRCLIADVPQRLLGDIVKRVAEQEESIELVGNINHLTDLSQIIENQSIDALIVGVSDSKFQQLYDGLIKQYSNLMVFALVDDGRRAAVYLDDIGVDEMLDLIISYNRR